MTGDACDVGAAGQPATVGAWIGFIAMAVGMFMAILDIQIVASSLPDIQAGLGISTRLTSWIQTAYLMAEVVAIPLTGFLARCLSSRGLFVAAVGGFTGASLGCAASQGFASLVVWRVVQGFCGGAIIPCVFSAVFLLFPPRLHDRATMIAGVLAMLAPTLGPTLGGWITETLSWHWLFLVNLPPGIVVGALVGALIAIDRPDWRRLRHIDYATLALIAIFLATLELALKQAPTLGWLSASALLMFAVCAGTGAAAVRRCLVRPEPIVDLRAFAERNFALGCWLSFALGMGLYGAVYLMPLFLGYIRQHSPLEIGAVMAVTGAAQLIAAPLATIADLRYDRRWLAALGYGLLAVGLALSCVQTYATDFDAMFWPQVVRGAALMLCILPVTTIALGRLPAARIANASGLFNLMRNLGGAIGLALVDTILEQRPPVHAERIVARLLAGDPDAARLVGLSTERFKGVPLGPIDQATKDFVAPLVERAAAVASFNDAWLLLAVLVGVALLAVPLLRHAPGDDDADQASG
jgi:DHA2 family multidrug resistance protein